MTIYPCTLSTTVTMKLFYQSKLCRSHEKVQESDQDISHANTSPEPVSQHALSAWLTQSDLLPNQRQTLYNVLQKNSGVFGSSIADLTSTPLVKHYIDTGNAKPIKQRAYRTNYHHRKEIEKQVEEMLQNDIIEPSVSPWASPVVMIRKADKTLRICIEYRNLNKITIKDSYPLPSTQDTVDTLYGNNLFTTLNLTQIQHGRERAIMVVETFQALRKSTPSQNENHYQ